MPSYLIVADDFTGSNDTGVQLSRRGLRTKVVFDGHSISGDGCSYVLDTESRNMPSAESGEKLAALLASTELRPFDRVIKKVDSTLRGNIARETLELDRAFGSELVIFMPALPALARTTVCGIHMLNGLRITETELARDPRKPVTQDCLAEILAAEFSEPVASLPLDTIRGGTISFDGARLFACDAETDADMRAVISAAAATGKRILWVGTAAIADNLLALDRPSAAALAVIASVSDTTRAQVLYAQSRGLSLVSVDVAALLRGGGADGYVRRAAELLADGRDVALISSATYDRAELPRSLAAGETFGMDAESVAAFAGERISEIAAELLRLAPVSGLFLCGGDTAIHFFERVGSHGSEILQEVSVGIPMMRLVGGDFDGLKVITKAGAFGSDEVLPAILRKLCEA
ncbi:MAG: four-carbon acid sugar kinase family protein [Oscillospiraceae bacterium]